MTEEQYWQQRTDREAHLARIEHEARIALLEEIKRMVYDAVYQWEESGRNARMRS